MLGTMNDARIDARYRDLMKYIYGIQHANFLIKIAEDLTTNMISMQRVYVRKIQSPQSFFILRLRML